MKLSRRLDIGGRAAVALAAFGSWLWQFGLMGSEFSADSSLATVMALRPFATTSLYGWGGNRQGMLVPLATRALHLALGLPVHATTQLVVYLFAALGLFLAMGLLESWPLRVALAFFFAWPSYAMAQSLCNPMMYLPTAFLLAMGQICAFRAAARDPTPLRIAWAAMLAGGLLWAADNCVVLFPAELWITGVALFRAREEGTWKRAAAAVAGVALPAAIIMVGKFAVANQGEVWELVRPSLALSVAVHLAPQLRQLAPVLGGAGVYVLVIVLFGWAATELWFLRNGKINDVSSLALLGTVPLLGLIGTSFSRHFEVNLRMSRYLSWPVLIAIVGGCVALDRLFLRARSPVWAQVGAWAAMLTLGIGCWFTRFSGIGPERVLVWGVDFGGPESESHWRHKVQLVQDQGCQGVIGNHWDVYPLMALTEGRILASPVGPAPALLNSSLALETVRQKQVCRIRTQRPDPGPCQPTETYFGSKLRLRDEVSEKVDGQEVHLCRFEPES
jgi:hypothetical protein